MVEMFGFQRGRGFGFPLESAKDLCVVGKVVGKELQGDMATQLQVFGFVYDTHASAADSAKNAVMGNRLPHGLGRGSHCVGMVGLEMRRVNESCVVVGIQQVNWFNIPISLT